MPEQQLQIEERLDLTRKLGIFKAPGGYRRVEALISADNHFGVRLGSKYMSLFSEAIHWQPQVPSIA